VPTTLAGHPFWEKEDPADRRAHQIHFLKNIGMLGGLLLAAVDTEGRPSLRYRTGRFVGDRRRSVRRGIRSARRDARIAVKSAAVGRHLPG
jgi:putative oxidoreductase